MSSVKEVIVKSINVKKSTYIDYNGLVQSIEPSTVYLLLNSDKTHERYVSDDKGQISKQGKELIDKNIRISDTTFGNTQKDFNEQLKKKIIELQESLTFDTDDQQRSIKDEIQDLNDAISSLEETIDNITVGAVSEAALFSVKQQKNLVHNEYVDVVNRYNALVTDPYLFDSTLLKNAYENATYGYLKRYNDLISFFDSAFSDADITQTEKDALNNHFTLYRNALGNLSIEMQKAAKRIEERRSANVDSKIEGAVNSVNLEISDVGTKLTLLQDSYLDFASDGVFSIAEAEALKTHIQLLEKEIEDVYAKFQEVHANPNLDQFEKDDLEGAYNAYYLAHTDLRSLILYAIEDGLSTQQEVDLVNQAFETYRQKLALLTRAFEVAINAIFNKSLDDLRLQIDGEIEDLHLAITGLDEQIENLPIGQVSDAALFAIRQQKNLVRNEYTDLTSRYDVIYNDAFLTDKTALGNAYGSASSGYLKAYNDLFSYLDTAFSDADITQVEKDTLQSLIDVYRGALEALSLQLQLALKAIEQAKIDALWDDLNDEIIEVRLEVGDVDSRITTLQGTYDEFASDGAFTIAEAKALEKYLNSLSTEKEDLESKFDVIYVNSFLDGIPKTNLALSYSNYADSHLTLINTITDAISDGKSNATEKQLVDNAFADYRTKLGLLSGAFEMALNYITTAKANDVNDKVFDGTGYFDPNKIKPLSVEAKHIAIGDRMQRFTLPNVTFYLEDSFTSLRHTAGTIVHQTIDITPKTWTIAANKITGITTVFQYVYIKADRDGTTATVLVTPAQIKVEQDPDYFHFEAGYISALQNGFRTVKTTFGFAQINPAELSIGKWSDPNNPTQYIEFNTEGIDIVAKRIRFMDSADVVVDVEEAIDEVAANVNYKTEILSSNGNMFRNDNIATTLTARLYHGKDDITDTIPQSSFTWIRKSHDTEADNQWNLLYANFHSNVLSISGDDVDGKAVFNCEVRITT